MLPSYLKLKNNFRYLPIHFLCCVMTCKEIIDNCCFISWYEKTVFKNKFLFVIKDSGQKMTSVVLEVIIARFALIPSAKMELIVQQKNKLYEYIRLLLLA